MDGITDAMDMSLGKFREMVGDREAWHAAYGTWGYEESDITWPLNNNKYSRTEFWFKLKKIALVSDLIKHFFENTIWCI